MFDPNRDKHRQVLKLADYKGYRVWGSLSRVAIGCGETMFFILV